MLVFQCLQPAQNPSPQNTGPLVALECVLSVTPGLPEFITSHPPLPWPSLSFCDLFTGHKVGLRVGLSVSTTFQVKTPSSQRSCCSSECQSPGTLRPTKVLKRLKKAPSVAPQQLLHTLIIPSHATQQPKSSGLICATPPPPWCSVPHQDSATGTFPSPPPCFQTNLSWASPPLHAPSYPHTDKCTNHLQPMPAWAPSGPTQLPVGVSLCQSPNPHLDTPLGDHTKTTSSKKPGLTPPASNHL